MNRWNLLDPGLVLFLVNQTAPAVGIEKAVKTRALSSVEVTHIEPRRPLPLSISPRSVVKCLHMLGAQQMFVNLNKAILSVPGT